MKKNLSIIALSVIGCLSANAQDTVLRYGFGLDNTGTGYVNFAADPGPSSAQLATAVNNTSGASDTIQAEELASGQYAFNTSGLGFCFPDGAMGVFAGETGTTIALSCALSADSSYEGTLVSFRFGTGGTTNYRYLINRTSSGFEVKQYNTSTALLTVSLTNSPTVGEWFSCFLTLQDESLSFYVYDATGSVVVSDSLAVSGLNGDQEMRFIQTGDFSQYAALNNLVSGVGVYDGALTSDNMAEVAKNGLVQSFSVPEPATATLSLLALAGLAARRRRK